ncbi:MAG: glycosyltransferase family 2 protein [Gemmatimonadaceae bacterium]
MTSVAISIVSTDEFPKVEACLRSIATQEFDGNLSVTVVCNGQPDDTARIRQVYPSAITIVNSVRRGFAENHNAALASVAAEFGLVLNPDVELAPTCVRELIAGMRVHPQAGVVGPLLRYPDGAAQPSARRFPRVAGTIVRRTPLRSIVGARLGGSRHFLPPPTADRTVDWLLGACLLVRNSAWARIGGFDPGYRPLYVEDIDLGWRMWRAGWEVWQTPSAEAIHEHQAATDKRFFDRRTLWHARGMIRFTRKHPRFLVGNSPRRS